VVVAPPAESSTASGCGEKTYMIKLAVELCENLILKVRLVGRVGQWRYPNRLLLDERFYNGILEVICRGGKACQPCERARNTQVRRWAQ